MVSIIVYPLSLAEKILVDSFNCFLVVLIRDGKVVREVPMDFEIASSERLCICSFQIASSLRHQIIMCVVLVAIV